MTQYLPRLAKWFITLVAPLIFCLVSVRLVMTPLYLQAEYNRPTFPADFYGLTTAERLQYAPLALDYLLNSEPISFLGDLHFESGQFLYNERELHHMQDVKNVTQAAFLIATIAAITVIVSTVFFMHRASTRLLICRAWFNGGILTIVLIISIIVVAVTSWDTFFTTFHSAFFDSDTWRFQYSDTLIRLFPEQFWFDASLVIGIITASQALIAIAIAFGIKRRLISNAASSVTSKPHLKVVAIGGGTGLPAVLRGLKHHTSDITAVVTVADDGGSSGRLRRDLGVLPPGDLRNNIVALADAENLMARLFQYRFDTGDLEGHAFGNLFITALASVTGSIEVALIETAKVLNIQGRVLPATLADVNLVAAISFPDGRPSAVIHGESSITRAGGKIEHMRLEPMDITAYEGSVQAILEADLVVIGPGSLFTSLLTNLLVTGIQDALRKTSAYRLYVCNVATQPGETTGFTVADHVLAIERHVGRGLFDGILANNTYPTHNQGVTQYVCPAPEGHDILSRYSLYQADLTDPERPWRHSSPKLADAILKIPLERKPIERTGITGII